MTTLRITATAIVLLALTGCSDAPDDDTSTDPSSASSGSSETPDQESATPTDSQEFTPSGDFATDVQAVGIEPDDMSLYEDFMADGVCDSELEPIAGESSFERFVRTTGDTSPESGRHPDVLRAAAAYNCPNRESLVEDALQKAEDGGYIN